MGTTSKGLSGRPNKTKTRSRRKFKGFGEVQNYPASYNRAKRRLA